MATRPDDLLPVEICEVWAANLEDEFAKIRDIIEHYPYVAVDVQHPGVVHRPLRPELLSKSLAEYNYATMKANVDVLTVIQIGLTFSDEHGTQPMLDESESDRRHPCAWQFNFRGFDPRTDIADANHIELLRRSGIDFTRHGAEGVDPRRFAELLLSSSVVPNMDLHWVTFDGRYGVGYLLKLLTAGSLPDMMSGFFDLVKIYFPSIYDIKHLMKFCGVTDSGLDDLANILDVKSARICYKAGSDSFLTALCFNKLRQGFFNGSAEKYGCELFGLEQ
ncbi:probable CCR4-associated factor 1 homolog 7 [Miscanthus floridulus]|uniref:probable CCR4-associated factor 1 homolog 7 n=1 Tax=Miscanthus floridulus TaxID=154761 RepID=UPI003458A5DE